MDIEEQKLLRLLSVDIINVNFKVYDVNIKENTINLECDSAVLFSKESPLDFKIYLNIKLNSDKHFNLEVAGIGDFQFSKELPIEERKELVNRNATAIMFPYLRSFITTFTSNCGNAIGTVIIPIQFFKGELKEIVPPEPAQTKLGVETKSDVEK